MKRSSWLGAAIIGALVLGVSVQASQISVHLRFDDHDRDSARHWYETHHDHLPIGLRDHDRLAPELEVKMEEGLVLDKPWRDRLHPAPPDLVAVLGPVPRGDRYMLLGGHVVLIDRGYRVVDVIHLGHDH